MGGDLLLGDVEEDGVLVVHVEVRLKDGDRESACERRDALAQRRTVSATSQQVTPLHR